MKIRFDGNNQTIFEADFDGDGKTDFARPARTSDGEYSYLNWQYIQSSDGRYQSIHFGYSINGGFISDGAVPGDYDGDGKTDLAVWRQNLFGPNYYIIRSSRNGSVTWWQWSYSNVDNHPLQQLYLRF